MAVNLLRKLCCKKPILRYKSEIALRHPWITGKTEDTIPLTMLEENMLYYSSEQKFRKVMGAMHFLGLIKAHQVQSKFAIQSRESPLTKTSSRKVLSKSKKKLIVFK